MSDVSIVLNIIVLLGLMFYAVRTRNMSNKQSIKTNNKLPFRLYEAEESDPSLRHYRRGNFITSHPEDTDRLGEAYDEEKWRFTMPHAASDMLIESFSADEKKAYQIKRAIELSIEHLMIEMADDAECLKIIEER
jgi:hypothetical protein